MRNNMTFDFAYEDSILREKMEDFWQLLMEENNQGRINFIIGPQEIMDLFDEFYTDLYYKCWITHGSLTRCGQFDVDGLDFKFDCYSTPSTTSELILFKENETVIIKLENLLEVAEPLDLNLLEVLEAINDLAQQGAFTSKNNIVYYEEPEFVSMEDIVKYHNRLDFNLTQLKEKGLAFNKSGEPSWTYRDEWVITELGYKHLAYWKNKEQITKKQAADKFMEELSVLGGIKRIEDDCADEDFIKSLNELTKDHERILP